MNRILKFFLLALFFQLTISCGSDSDDAGSMDGDPSNLQLVVELADDGSGTVTVTATGDNVVEYEFDMGDNSDLIINTTGQVTYTYEDIGVYTVEVKAYGSSGRFLSDEEVIEVGIGLGEINDAGYSTPMTYDGYDLIWNDEFEGSALDETVWNYEFGTGDSGWGNNELQYYLRENTSVDQGYLIIEAKRQSFAGSNYTSSRLTTEDNFDFQYGRVDIRAKMPIGQGMWPALWMLGSNFRTVGWPFCGEIDIMEMVGGGDGKDNVVHGTIHWDADGTKADFGGSRTLPSGTLNDEFHVYSISWDATSIRWYMDDIQYHVVDIAPASLSEFRNDFFFIFNVAVGGNWPGSPNSSTVFPQRMIVDYVRVFQPQ